MAARVRPVLRGATAAAAALATVLALGACGAGEKATESATEKLLEQGLESGAGDDVDIDLDGEEVTVESSDGSFAMGGDVPDDFPAEVPLAEGEVVMSSSTPDGWSVILEVEEEFAEASEAALEAVLGAGFAEESLTRSGEYVALIASDETYDVMLTASPSGQGGTSLSYTVTTSTP